MLCVYERRVYQRQNLGELLLHYLAKVTLPKFCRELIRNVFISNGSGGWVRGCPKTSGDSEEDHDMHEEDHDMHT